MAKAKKLDSGNWRCLVYVGKDSNGKRKYESVTAPTKKEAEYRAAEIAYTRKQKTVPENMTLTEAINKYIESKENILSPSTIAGYKVVQRNRFQGLMQLKLKNIDSEKVQLAINADAKEHSEKTLRNALGLVKTVLSVYAPDTKLNIALPMREKFEPNTLTVEQIGVLLKAIQGDVAELPILLALWLGLRASEVAGLTWDCYNAEEKTLHIRQALVLDDNRERILKSTKTTNSKRVVSLPDYICDKINELPKGSHDEFIITITTQLARRRLQKICEENGLPKIRFHDLRHANASIMLLLGVPQKYAMERGGWSSPQTMERIYQHTFKDEKKNVDENINNYINNLIKPKEE